MTDEQRQEMRELLIAMPDWAKPVWFRAAMRLKNNVPYAKVEQRAMQEFEAAKAKQQKMTGEPRP